MVEGFYFITMRPRGSESSRIIRMRTNIIPCLETRKLHLLKTAKKSHYLLSLPNTIRPMKHHRVTIWIDGNRSYLPKVGLHFRPILDFTWLWWTVNVLVSILLQRRKKNREKINTNGDSWSTGKSASITSIFITSAWTSLDSSSPSSRGGSLRSSRSRTSWKNSSLTRLAWMTTAAAETSKRMPCTSIWLKFLNEATLGLSQSANSHFCQQQLKSCKCGVALTRALVSAQRCLIGCHWLISFFLNCSILLEEIKCSTASQ